MNGVLLSITPSRSLAWILIGAHIAAGACVVALHPPWWIALAAGTVLLASVVFHLLRDALRRLPDSVTTLQARKDGSYRLTLRNGESPACRLLGSSFVTPWLTIVNVELAEERSTRHVVIVPDAVSAGDFRRLRVWLRWKGAAHAAEAAGAEEG